jgi:hypothetical protein
MSLFVFSMVVVAFNTKYIIIISMVSRKTKKLSCIITGKVLTATNDYYNRKVEKLGSEEKLHETYVCKEAKNLVLKGYSVEKIREMLEIDDEGLPSVSQQTLSDIIKNTDKQLYRRVNTFNSVTNMINTRTDPRVLKLIENIKNESK